MIESVIIDTPQTEEEVSIPGEAVYTASLMASGR